jgi:hypothetical protein
VSVDKAISDYLTEYQVDIRRILLSSTIVHTSLTLLQIYCKFSHLLYSLCSAYSILCIQYYCIFHSYSCIIFYFYIPILYSYIIFLYCIPIFLYAFPIFLYSFPIFLYSYIEYSYTEHSYIAYQTLIFDSSRLYILILIVL